MKIAVARETRDGETRVAMVPDLVGKLTALGYDVAIENGAGETAGFADTDYESAGATIDQSALVGADVIISVRPLDPGRIADLPKGTATVSFLPVNQSLDFVDRLRNAGISSFAMELVPRISRAQSMDALSSQALVAGYRCGVVAAEMLRRFFPLNMTAAGTVRPAQVVVLGAGVAGLQAIATAKRLGAVVSAYDVRSAAAEEIASVGAKAIDLDLETLEGAGGYAREMTRERADKQRELLTPYIAAADALITTAAVPGRQAPVLVTREMVEQMKPGSVVVDLAADSGGNVEGSVPGETVEIGGVLVWGGGNVAAQMPGPASTLYAQNVVNLITLMTRKRVEAGEGETAREASFAPDFDDEIVAGCCVTHDGRIEHKPTREAIDGPDPEPEPVPAVDSSADMSAEEVPSPVPAAPTRADMETMTLEPIEEPLAYLDEPDLEPLVAQPELQQAPAGPLVEITEDPIDLEGPRVQADPVEVMEAPDEGGDDELDRGEENRVEDEDAAEPLDEEARK